MIHAHLHVSLLGLLALGAELGLRQAQDSGGAIPLSKVPWEALRHWRRDGNGLKKNRAALLLTSENAANEYLQ
jgi:hypothetical protein